MTLLEKIKKLSGNTDDVLLNLMIERTQTEIALITKKTYDALTMDNLLIDMVLVKLNLKGNEGINSVSYNGIAETFLPNYPNYILRQLDSLKKRVKLLW